MISKIFFAPFAMIGGLIAGLLGKRIFKTAWGLIDDREPPKATDGEARWSRVVIALVLQGAIFSASRGVVDRMLRKAFAYLTGYWPGQRRAKSTS
ncbi:MAG: DUF4235 domain-containing protein [Solirubrobacteraceae bacterium]